MFDPVALSSNNKTLNARLLERPRHKFVTGATLLQLVALALDFDHTNKL